MPLPLIATQTRRRLRVQRLPWYLEVIYPLWYWLRRLLHLIRCRSLAFTMQHQEQTQWCWSATTVSVSHFYNAASTWTQCALVNAELVRNDCCPAGNSAACNVPWTLSDPLTRTGNLASWQNGTITYASIQGQIDTGRVVCCRIGWSGGGGHFCAIRGYCSTTADWLNIGDPWYGDSSYTYPGFSSAYQGSGSWTHTYLTQP
ncbi:MAG TPA: papain-like cysteine protease family protein [Longimicrobium sp.]